MTDRPIILFVKAILRYWWALMSCAAFTLLGIWVTYANKSRGWILWSSLVLAVAFLFVAAYKAWAHEHQGWAGETERSAAVIQDLREQLAQKHPYDENLVSLVGKAIDKLDHDEVRFLGWLLTMDRPLRGQIQREGFGRAPESILEKTGRLLVAFEAVCPGNGLVEMDRHYYINPKSEESIKNVLYPPPRRSIDAP